MNRDAIVSLLDARGAGELDHPGGTLLDHLVRTGEILRSWGAAPPLVLAGVAPAAYGTDGFPTALFGLEERDVVRKAIGSRAEEMVYRYASCARAATLGAIGNTDRVPFRDRFTGAVTFLDSEAVHLFAELTVANELDVMLHNEAFPRQPLERLFGSWRSVISAQAWDACQTVFAAGPDRRSEAS